MASGTGERPLGTVAEEKTLLGLFGLQFSRFEMTANTTRYLVFRQQNKGGLLVCWSNGDTGADKCGLYQLASSSSNAIVLPVIKTFTRTGMSITPLSNTAIEIVNPSGYLWVAVLMFYGESPTMETSAPT
jgi:hypothetical protein